MPHLISAPTTDKYTDSYQITIDDQPPVVSPAQITDQETGEKKLFFDITGLVEGDHHVIVQGKGLWGLGPEDPFDFRVQLPGEVSGVAVSD